MSDRAPERPVDELREQLRALGYLDARVDRFVLGRSASARPARLAFGASVRIGALAGVLLGPAAALGLTARAPSLVTNATDAIVAAAYLALLFGAAAMVLAAVVVFGGTAIVRRLASRTGFSSMASGAATGAGLFVGGACLTYLMLWWRLAAGLGDGASLGWALAAIVVAVAISLLLGHAVALTILAVLARIGLAEALRPGRPLSTRVSLATAALVASAGAVALLVALAPASTADANPPPLTVVPTGQRVIVIGIDGVDPSMLDALVAAGRVPTMARLLSGAVSALSPETDRDPARVWTTIATGQPAERHGIRALESREVAGLEGRLPDAPAWPVLTSITDLLKLTRPAIASGDERRIPAFWEVAARAGLRTAVVQWWATWPAPRDLGIVISDRALLRLEHGGALDAEVAPAALYDELTASWPARKARAVEAAARAIRASTSEDVTSAIRRSAEIDATVIDLAVDVARDGRTDLLTVYLPGLDIAQHALFGRTDAAVQRPSVAAERVSSLEQYYVFLDQALEAIVPADSADVTVVLIAEPGRVGSPLPGRIAIWGGAAGDARAATTVPTAIAATVLQVLGIPAASDLDAGPDLDLLSKEFVAAHPVRTVATYGERRERARARGGRPLDREMIERMRSLGYLR